MHKREWVEEEIKQTIRQNNQRQPSHTCIFSSFMLFIDITDNTVHQILVRTQKIYRQYVVIWIEYLSLIIHLEPIDASRITPYQSKHGYQILWIFRFCHSCHYWTLLDLLTTFVQCSREIYIFIVCTNHPSINENSLLYK